jgi:membrane-bound lytic murein transglycosylase D
VQHRRPLRPEQVAQWNDTTVGARFKPGQTVSVMVANKPTRVAADRTPAKAGTAKRLAKPAATARSRAPAN